MSQPAPAGREAPRWSAASGVTKSVSRHALTGTASTAMLDGRSAIVCVGPPLFARPDGSRPAAWLFRSPAWVKNAEHELSSARL